MEEDARQPGGRACRGVPVAALVEEVAGGGEQLLGRVHARRRGGRSPRTLEQTGPLARLVGELGGSPERALRLVGGRKRERALACPLEPVARGGADLARLRGVHVRPDGVEVVRRDHLGDLVGVQAGLLREVARGGEVLRLAVAAGEGLVGDALDECLEEPVLAPLGGAGVRVEEEKPLRTRVARSPSTSSARGASAASPRAEKVLPSTEASWRRRRSVSGSPVDEACDQGVERLRDVEVAELAEDTVRALGGLEQSAVEQCANRFDRVEGNAVGPLADSGQRVVGQTGHPAEARPSPRPTAARAGTR
jgi:hypothetical protein